MIEEYIGKDVAPLSLSFRVLSSLNALCLSVDAVRFSWMDQSECATLSTSQATAYHTAFFIWAFLRIIND